MEGKSVPDRYQPRSRILVLDVDERTLITLEQVLEEAGFETTTTWSVDEALHWSRNRHFDLLAVGDHPPEIDAQAFLDQLRASHRVISCVVMRGARITQIGMKSLGTISVVPDCASAHVLAQVQQMRESLAPVAA